MKFNPFKKTDFLVGNLRGEDVKIVRGFSVGIKADIEFNADGVRIPLNYASEKFFKRAGAYIRGVARRSIKNVEKQDKKNWNKGKKQKISAPGHAPYSHDHYPDFRNSILFRANKYSAVISSERRRGGSFEIGYLHETGGTTSRKIIPDYNNLGKPVEIGKKAYISKECFLKNAPDKQPTEYHDPYNRNLKIYVATVRNKGMSAHAARLKKRIIDNFPTTEKTVRYPKRPFLWPAMTNPRARVKITGFWQDAIKP